MATLFQTGFPHIDPDNAPIQSTDFENYVVAISGAAPETAFTYSDTQYITGGFSAYVNVVASNRYLDHTFSVDSEEVWFRTYLYVQSLPTSQARFARIRSNSANTIASLYIETDGKISCGDGNTGTANWTSTSTYANQWIRVEWRVSSPFAGSGGDQRVRIYAGANLHTTTTTEQSAIVPTTTYVGGVQKFQIGEVTVNTTAQFYLEAVQINDDTWVGPIEPPPIAAFTVNTSSGSAPLTINFTNTSTYATSYIWDFGDGSATSTATNPSHTYTSSGTYVVTLAAFNASGKERIATLSIEVTQSGTGATLFDLTYEGGQVGAPLNETLGGGTVPDPVGRPFTPYTSSAFFYGRADDATVESAETTAMRDFFNAEVLAGTSQPRDYFILRGFSTNSWGTPRAVGTASDPVWTINPSSAVNFRVQWLVDTGFRAPANLDDYITGTSDSPILIHDEVNRCSIFLTAANPAAGNVITCSQYAAVTYWDSNGLDYRNPLTDNSTNFTSRGRISDAMVIRKDIVDWAITNNTDLGHVIHMFWTETLTTSGFCHPMVGTESSKFGWGKEGQRLRLRQNLDVESIPGMSAGGKVIARTLQRYGAYIGDNAGAGGASLKLEMSPSINWTGVLTEDDIQALKIEDFEVVPDGWTGTASTSIPGSLAYTGSAPATYVSTNAIKGTRAAAIDGRAAGGQLAYTFDSPQSLTFFRNYVTVTTPPVNREIVLASAYNSGTGLMVARISVDEYGIWRLRKGDNQGVGNIAATSSMASTHKAVHRLEWRVDTTSKEQELRIYVGSNAQGTTPDIVLSGGVPGSSAVTEIRFGVEQACGGQVTIDQTAVGTDDWIGAVSSPNSTSGIPVAGFTATALTIPAGGKVLFKNKSTNSPTSYAWNFGDGTGNGTNPAHTYAGGGSFPVTMTATNAFGTSAPALLNVTAIASDRGLAVPKVRSSGAWQTSAAGKPFVQIREEGGWQATGTFRVFKNGQWSSSIPIGTDGGDGGGGTNATGWGAGTQSLGTWYGSSIGLPGTNQESYDWTLETFGALDIIRAFDSGTPTGWTWSGTTSKARIGLGTVSKVSWYSFKFPIADRDILSGRVTDSARKTTLLNNFRQFVDSIPQDVRVWLTVHHEPENDDPSWTASEFRNLQAEMQAVVTAHRATRTSNKNKLKYLPILMGWTLDPNSGRNAASWHTSGVDAWGYDAYQLRTQKLASAYAIDNGYPYAFGELGVREDGTDTKMRDSLLNMWIGWQDFTKAPKGAVYWNAKDGDWEIYATYTGVPRIAPHTVAPPRPLLSELWRSICQTGYPPTSLWP